MYDRSDIQNFQARYQMTSIPTIVQDGSLWDAVARHEKHDQKMLRLKKSLGICRAAQLLGKDVCEAPEPLGKPVAD
tara:strand:- start:1518 stop:1745 length:228 start_codon:yes stop_codon:yes gene_type:complete